MAEKKPTKIALSDLMDMEEELSETVEHSYETKDNTGRFGNYFIGDIPRWTKLSEGPHTIAIWPFRIPDDVWKSSPFRNAKNNLNQNKQKVDYKLIIYIHSNIGPNRDTIICPDTIGKPCPVCELRKSLDKDADKDLYEALYRSKKVLYNVHVLDNENEKAKGIRVYDASHKYIEKALVLLAYKGKRGTKRDKPLPFYKPFENYVVSFTREGTGATTTEYIGLAIEELEGEDRYTDKEMEKLLPEIKVLDSIVQVLPYDTIKEMIGEAVASSDKPKTTRRVLSSIEDDLDESVRQLDDDSEGTTTTVDDSDIQSLREELGITDVDEDPISEDPTDEKSEVKPKREEKKLVIPSDCADCFGKETGDYEECEKCTVFAPCLEQKRASSKKVKTRKKK